MSTCTITNCSRETMARGMCSMHYGQWYRATPPSAKRGRRSRLDDRRCELCNNWFHPRLSTTRFCSRECSSAARRLPDRACDACGQTFTPRLNTTRFCSTKCWGEARKITLPPIECAECGATVEHPRPGRKYCSRECSYLGNTRDRETTWSIHRRTGIIDARAGREPRIKRGTRGRIGVAYFEGYDSAFDDEDLS